MKIKSNLSLAIVVLLLATVGIGIAYAGAYDTSFTTSITYQNIGSSSTTGLSVDFYDSPTDTTPINVVLSNLGPGASSSVFVGSLGSISPGFQGTAILKSDQPMLATLVQVPQGSTTVIVRPLSNGFGGGGSTALIATILKNTFGSTSILSVQNTDSEQNDIVVDFYNTSAALVDTVTMNNVEAGAGFYIDAGLQSGLGTSFNGSAVITAERNDNSAGNVIGSVMELDITGVGGKAFESVAAGSTTFYMPSALCDVFGGQSTAYAVQNTSLSMSTDVTVTYSNGTTDLKTIGAGSKQSFQACDVLSSGFSGSAIVTSSAQAVIAVGKAFGAGLSTAFLGASSGAEVIGLPYVRWTSTTNYNNGSQQRVFLAIQNVGGSTVTGVTVAYIAADGSTDGTHLLAPILAGAKANSNAGDAGLTEFGNPNAQPGYGGGVIITGPSGSQLVVIARVQTCVGASGGTCFSAAAEDYNGVEIPD